MFCGWELMFDYKRLAELNNGTLLINILTEECFHNGKEIEPLKIVSGIHHWMVEDLKDNNINPGQITCAELEVKFKTTRQLGQEIQNSSWADPTPHFIKCMLECCSKIKTKDREFTSSYRDEEEWPESYSWVS